MDIIGVENKDGLASEVISGCRSSHVLVLLASLMLRKCARRGKKWRASLCYSSFLVTGTTGVFFQLLLVLGILYAYCTGFTRDVVAISSLCCIAPIVFGITMILMPESPLFYLTKNKEEEARKSMRFFRGPDFDIEPEMEAFKVG